MHARPWSRGLVAPRRRVRSASRLRPKAPRDCLYGKGESMPPTKSSGVRPACLVVVLLAGLAATTAQAQTTLRWKFQPNEKLNYQMDQKMTSKASAGGQNLTSTMDQTVDTTWEVKSVSNGT